MNKFPYLLAGLLISLGLIPLILSGTFIVALPLFLAILAVLVVFMLISKWLQKGENASMYSKPPSRPWTPANSQGEDRTRIPSELTTLLPEPNTHICGHLQPIIDYLATQGCIVQNTGYDKSYTNMILMSQPFSFEQIDTHFVVPSFITYYSANTVSASTILNCDVCDVCMKTF